MNFSGLALKLNSIFNSGSLALTSLLSNSQTSNTVEATSFGSGLAEVVVNFIINLILKVIWWISQFLLNVIELFEFATCKILGITVDINDYVVLDTTNPLIKMLTSDAVLQTFKLMLGVSIVLIIVFTIFSIIRSEYKFAVEGDVETNSSKGKIFIRTLKSFFLMGMFPLILIFVIIVVNAILAGFNDIMRQGQRTTISGQLFAVTAYQGNNYRLYAENDARIPVCINFNDPEMLGQAGAYESDELFRIYDAWQDKGKEIYKNYAYQAFGSFNETVVYKNNRLYNNSNFTGFENFVCTREQYYVLADFIDYAVKYNVEFQIKNVKDVDINWKYVNSANFDNETKSLTITYKDASNLNDGTSYKVVYTPTSDDISTPIADALRTISALLAVGNYSNDTFSILNRLEDSINIVEWNTKKVWLKLSDGLINAIKSQDLIEITNSTDQIILYEWARYENNNTLDYSLEQLCNGIELPLKELNQRKYDATRGTYISTGKTYVVEINGNYYEVEENLNLRTPAGKLFTDAFNNAYYTILPSDLVMSQAGTNKADNIFQFNDNGYVINLKEIDSSSSNAYKAIKFKNLRQNTTAISFSDVLITKKSGVVYEDYVDENGVITTVTSTYDDQVSTVKTQVSWPQKLINDLQVIYKDININHMLTTGNWLEQLGEYANASNTEGDNTSNISTSLIHPLGLIFAELFLGIVEDSTHYNTTGSSWFSSQFDSETIKALMLSMLGEDNYHQIRLQFEYFSEIFNVYFGPVLDEIAYFENFDMTDGADATVYLYTYKAYLASLMLSESSADWFYSTANALLGNIGFETDIWNSCDEHCCDEHDSILNCTDSCFDRCAIHTSSADNFGYYRQYTELDNKYKSGEQLTNLVMLYLDNVEKLEDMFIFEGSDNYPEYMLALRDYIYGQYSSTNGVQWNGYETGLFDDSLPFNGRLEIVLKSRLSDDQINKNLLTIENAILTKEISLNTHIEHCFENGYLSPKMYAQYLQATSGLNIETLANYKTDTNVESFRNKLLKNDALLLESINSINNSTFKNACLRYYEERRTKYNEYIELKLDYLFGDTSATNFDKRGELEEKKEDILDNVDSVVNDIDSMFGNIDSLFLRLNLRDYTDYILGFGLPSWLDPDDLWFDDGSISHCGCDCCDSSFSTPPPPCGNCCIKCKFNNYLQCLEAYNDIIKAFYEKSTSNGILYKDLIEDYFAVEEDEDRAVGGITKADWDNFIANFESLKVALEAKNEELKVKKDALTEAYNAAPNTFTIDGEPYNKVDTDLGMCYSQTLDVHNYYTSFVTNLERAIEYQDKIDNLNRYYITYAVRAITQDRAEVVYKVVVNNKEFEVGNRATRAKLVEYVFGAEYLNDLGYETVFVPDYYKGFYSATDKDFEFDEAKMFSALQDFLIEVGETSATIYQMTNMVNLSTLAYDELTLDKVIGNGNGEIGQSLAKLVVKMIVNTGYIPDDIKLAIFGNVDAINIVNSASNEACENYVNALLSYLLLTDSDESQKQYVDYTTLTLKEVRLKCMDFLINYEDQKGETFEQNQRRYLAVFELLCSDWQKGNGGGVDSTFSWLDENLTSSTDSIKSLKTNIQTKAVVLKLAGLENRPYEELVGAEYTIDFNLDQMSGENNGDIYIITTFDEEEGYYIPFMMTNQRNGKGESLPEDEEGLNWFTKYGYKNCYSDYYTLDQTAVNNIIYYPIIAKGVIDENGNPTAIRENNGYIEFYRNNIIIHDTSKLKLEEYYVTSDEIPMAYTGLSMLANTITKLFTGKSLTDIILENIPRYAASSNFNLCYGINLESVELLSQGNVKMSYNFNPETCIDMEHMYSLQQMNILILIIGICSLLMATWKAVWAVTQRMFDVVIYTILGPAAIATINLKTDSKDDDGNIQESNTEVFDLWYKNISEKLLSVFAYAIGFNMFLLVAPIISNITLFESTAAFATTGIFSNINIHFLNEVARLIFLIAAAYTTTRAPKLFAKISDTKDGFEQGKEVIGNVKNAIKDVGYTMSGQKVMDLAEEAVDQMKHIIPGSEMVEKGAKAIKRQVGGVAVQAIATASGVGAGAAKQMADAYKNADRQKEARKEKKRQERKERIRKYYEGD